MNSSSIEKKLSFISKGNYYKLISELIMSALVVITVLPFITTVNYSWIADYHFNYITLSIIAFNLLLRITYLSITSDPEEKSSIFGMLFDPSNWIDISAIAFLFFPGQSLIIFSLIKLLKLPSSFTTAHTTVTIFKWVASKYGFIIIETALILLFVLFILSTGILYISIESNYTAFAGNNIFTLWDAFYYSFIASMTIGFGDITPLSTLAQSYTIVLAVYGMMIIAIIGSIIISGFTTSISKYHSINAETSVEKSEIFNKMTTIEVKESINKRIIRFNKFLKLIRVKQVPILKMKRETKYIDGYNQKVVSASKNSSDDIVISEKELLEILKRYKKS